MARIALSDEQWEKLRVIMKTKGCRLWKNSRNVMEAILWKLRTSACWRDIPEEICPWQTAFNRFNRWAKKGLWEGFFFAYEAMLIKSGLSGIPLLLELINMRVELGLVKKELLGDRAVALLQRYTCVPIRMEIRSVLKSLGVTPATVKLRQSS